MDTSSYQPTDEEIDDVNKRYRELLNNMDAPNFLDDPIRCEALVQLEIAEHPVLRKHQLFKQHIFNAIAPKLPRCVNTDELNKCDKNPIAFNTLCLVCGKKNGKFS